MAELIITFATPHGEPVALPLSKVEAWIEERLRANNYGAADAARAAVKAQVEYAAIKAVRV